MKKKQKLLFSCGIILLLSAYGLLAGFTFSKMAEIRSSKSKVLLQESQKEVNSRKSIALAQLALLLEADDEGYLIAGEKAEIAGYNDIAASYYKKIKTAEGLTILGNTYLKNNQNKEAEEAFQKALNKEEGLKALTGLGTVYLKQGLAEKAKKSFDRALELVKDDENALSGSKLADLVLDQQILDEKIGSDSINQQLQKIVQTPTLSTRINLLFEYLRENNYPQLAINFLQEKERVGQLDRDGYLLLANEYFLERNYVKSYQSLLSAKTKDLYYPQTYQHLIEVAKLLGKEDEAKQYQDFLKIISW